MLRYLKVHIQNRKKKWSTAETAADHFALHGSSLALTFYSPFCWGDTLIYMDLCEPKSFEFLKIWRYMDIYKDTWQVEMPTIPNFIYVHLLIQVRDILTYYYTRYPAGAQAFFRIFPSVGIFSPLRCIGLSETPFRFS